MVRDLPDELLLNENDEEIQHASEEVRELTKQLEYYKAMTEALKRNKGKSEMDSGRLQRSLLIKSEEMRRLQRDRKYFEEYRMKSKKEISGLKTDLFDRGEQLLKLRRSLKSKDSKREWALEFELQECQKELGKSKEQLKHLNDFERNNHKLRKRISMYQESLRNKNRELVKLKSRYEISQAMEEKVKQENQKLRTKVGAMQIASQLKLKNNAKKSTEQRKSDHPANREQKMKNESEKWKAIALEKTTELEGMRLKKLRLELKGKKDAQCKTEPSHIDEEIFEEIDLQGLTQNELEEKSHKMISDMKVEVTKWKRKALERQKLHEALKKRVHISEGSLSKVQSNERLGQKVRALQKDIRHNNTSKKIGFKFLESGTQARKFQKQLTVRHEWH